jgi:ectoine hydroxylase
MTPEAILANPPRVLTQSQREGYFATGLLSAERLIPDAWLRRLHSLSADFIEQSRRYATSNEAFDLAPQHRADRPHVRRLRALVDRHEDFWCFASQSVLADIAADLVGPDVKFHSSKLNYKWPGSSEVVKWHQDVPAWPHTNYSLVTLGVYLGDVLAEHGPLTCVRGSHAGPIFVHRDDAGSWTGDLRRRYDEGGPFAGREPDRRGRHRYRHQLSHGACLAHQHHGPSAAGGSFRI